MTRWYKKVAMLGCMVFAVACSGNTEAGGAEDEVQATESSENALSFGFFGGPFCLFGGGKGKGGWGPTVTVGKGAPEKHWAPVGQTEVDVRVGKPGGYYNPDSNWPEQQPTPAGYTGPKGSTTPAVVNPSPIPAGVNSDKPGSVAPGAQVSTSTWTNTNGVEVCGVVVDVSSRDSMCGKLRTLVSTNCGPAKVMVDSYKCP